jgi:hypothetical protein
MSEKLDKSQIYDHFERVTRQTKDLLDRMEQLQLQITEVWRKMRNFQLKTNIYTKLSLKVTKNQNLMNFRLPGKTCKSCTNRDFMCATNTMVNGWITMNRARFAWMQSLVAVVISRFGGKYAVTEKL